MKKKIVYFLFYAFVLLLFTGCGKKEKIAYYFEEANVAVEQGRDDKALEAYSKILELDPDNAKAKKGFIEVDMNQKVHDEYLCTEVKHNLCEIIELFENDHNGFVTPSKGDYSLGEFVDGLGEEFSKRFYEKMDVNDSAEIEAKLTSKDYQGFKLKGKEIRVAVYSTGDEIEMCVYVPDSLDPESGYIIYGGAKYKPYY